MTDRDKINYEVSINELVVTRSQLHRAMDHLNNSRVGNELPVEILKEIADIRTLMAMISERIKALSNMMETVIGR